MTSYPCPGLAKGGLANNNEGRGDLVSKKQSVAILVPVDFSPASEAAVAWAADVAATRKAHLVILHIVHDLGEAPGFYAVKGRKKQLQRMEDIAADMLDDFKKKLVEKHPNLIEIKHAKLELVVGLPVPRILEMIKKIQPEMVIMGSQGRTGLGYLMLGSKAEQMVRLCPVPVTVVKAPEEASKSE